ncbi:MAG: DUF6776 family protein [Halioglobus sp.]
MKIMPSQISRLVDHLGPRLVWMFALLLVLILLVGILLGHYLNGAAAASRGTVKGLRQEVVALNAALKGARGDLEMQRTRHEVDRRALELLRSEMAAEKERTADLEEGISFYRSMLVSDDVNSGISVRTPELVAGTNSGQIRYRFFIQQKERESEMVEGALSVEVYGVSGEHEVSYPLSKLSKEFNDKAATLHFRYFQAIEGELTLPEGFEARGLKLLVRASKPRSTQVRERFPWELQERFINVGK